MLSSLRDCSRLTHVLVEYIDDRLVVSLLAGVHERRAPLLQRRAHISAFLRALHLLALDLSALVHQVSFVAALRFLEDARDGLAPAAGGALVHNRGVSEAPCVCGAV